MGKGVGGVLGAHVVVRSAPLLAELLPLAHDAHLLEAAVLRLGRAGVGVRVRVGVGVEVGVRVGLVRVRVRVRDRVQAAGLGQREQEEDGLVLRGAHLVRVRVRVGVRVRVRLWLRVRVRMRVGRVLRGACPRGEPRHGGGEAREVDALLDRHELEVARLPVGAWAWGMGMGHGHGAWGGQPGGKGHW